MAGCPARDASGCAGNATSRTLGLTSQDRTLRRGECSIFNSITHLIHNAADDPTRLQASQEANKDLTERLGYMERIVRHYLGHVSLDSANLRDLAQSIEGPHDGGDRSVTPRQDASSSHHSGYLDPEEESFTVQPVANNITHYSGEFSHWNFSMRIKQWIEQCVYDQGHPHHTGPLSFKEYYRPMELQSASDPFASLTASLPPRDVADFLVEVFFRYVETNYWYLEYGWLQERLHTAYTIPSDFTRRDVGTVCIIFIVLAIGTQYAYLDSQHQAGNLAQPGPYSEDVLGVLFYQQACKLLPDVIAVSSLESVQACLLMGVFTLPLDASGLSYIYLNLAIKLAIQNGMHRKYPGGELDRSIKETRIRVWWTVYAIERRVGIFHGRPTSIASTDVDAELPTVDFTDIWPSSSTSQIQAMLATLQLHDILSKILQEMSSLKLHAKRGAFDTLSRLVDLSNDLHKWWDAIPESMCRKNLASCHTSNPITRREAHIHLEYHMVRLFAGRPFIFLRVANRGSSASASSSPAEQAQQSSYQPHQQYSHTSPRSRIDARSVLVSDCVEAALAIIDTCKALQDGVGAARASYTEFSSCRVALLVIITQCLQGKTERLRQSLKDGVGIIRELSAGGGESARSEASLIEVLERAIARLDVQDDASNPYARFKKWEMLFKNDSSAGSNNQATASSAAGMANDAAREAPVPDHTLFTPIAGSWGGTRGDPGGPGMAAGSSPTWAGPWAAISSMDWDFSFPQTMDEFSTMFSPDFGLTHSDNPGSGANLWPPGT
ncbi:Fungal trans [Geosmithia morbida]|uniref:Fungal trans n=1 Tax=Geosmithia morbida TaxID=1094350 RepID=A0A9P5D3S4_9HYPO|nr:Fungal trans [Geosmithia morbida]KAF4120799.1 Fungal trans [Geosmithia morbida]